MPLPGGIPVLTRLLIRMKPMRLFMMPTGYEKPCEVYFPLNPLSRIEGGPCVALSPKLSPVPDVGVLEEFPIVLL